MIPQLFVQPAPLRLLIVAFAVWAALPLAAPAAESELVGLAEVATEPGTAAQLRLSDNQIKRLNDLIDQRLSDALNQPFSAKGIAADEKKKLMEPFRAESDRLTLAILTEPQRDQLRQAVWTRDGLAALGDGELAKRLNLSPEQQSRIAKILTERQGALATATGGVRDKLTKSFDTQLLAVLSEEQQTGWKEVIGVKKAAVAPRRGPGGAANRTAVAEASQDASPVTEATDASTEDEAPAAEDRVEKEESPARVARKDSPRDDVESPNREDGLIRFNFSNQNWRQALDWLAENADLSLVMDTPPQGTLNLTDLGGYTPDEAIDVLNGILLTKGYTLIRNNRMLMVVNLDDGIPPNLVPQVSPDELDKRGRFEMVKVRFPLTKMTPDDAIAELKNLLGPQGTVIPLVRTRSIQVTETAGNLRTIKKVLDEIESPRKLTVFYPTQLETTVTMIRQMMSIPSDSTQTTDGSLSFAIDAPGKRLFVSGTADKVSRVEEIIKMLDGDAAAIPGVQSLVPYTVSRADPQTVYSVLATLLEGQPGVKLSLDTSSNKIIALAKPSQHATIQATIERLERDGRAFTAIQLRTIDAASAVMAINNLYGGEGGKPASSAPLVEAEPNNRQLLVRGTQSQIAEIRSLISEMEGDTADGMPADRGNDRTIPLTGRNAERALQEIQAGWSTLHKNKIRVVNPSDAGSKLRDRRGAAYEPGNNSPNEDKPKDETSDRRASGAEGPQTRARPRTSPFQFAVQNTEVDNAERETDASSEDEAPEITVIVTKTGIRIISEDKEALNDLESELRRYATQANAAGRDFTVYYLKSATATTAAEMLTQIFNGGAASGSGGGSLLTDLASSALGDAGGGMMSTLLGLGGGGSEAISLGGSLLIVPETRLNALIVHGNPKELDTVEQLLDVIDRPDAPENMVVLRPRLIPVIFSKATDIAETVKAVYSERLVGAGGAQRQPSPEDFIRMLGGNRSRGSRSGSTPAEQQKMSIGVDSRTNSLVVNAPEALFLEVEELVQLLDEDQPESTQVVKVIPIRQANSDSVQKALKAILGDNVQTASTGSSDSSNPFSRGFGSSSSSSGSGGSSSSSDDDSRRRREEFFRSRFGSGGFGGFGGFGGSSGFGGFGGDRGSSGRSGGDRGGGDRGRGGN